MSLPNLFSRWKKKLRCRPAGGRRTPELGGTNATGEGVGGMGSLRQPKSHPIEEHGYDPPQPGNEANADGGRADSTDPLPHSDPGFVPVSESGHDNGGREVVVGGREAGEGDSHLCPGFEDVEDVAGSGLSREWDNFDGGKANRTNPPPSEGTQTPDHFSR